MDKKELFQQLLHMKEEYAKKCKRLQLAVRAKNSREHVRRKIHEQNDLSADEGSFQDESSYNGSFSSPIVSSNKEKTLDLSPSNSTRRNADSPGNEQLQSKNSRSVNSTNQKPTLIKKTNENVSRCSSPLNETTGSSHFGDGNKNVEKYESTSREIQIRPIISSAKSNKVSIHTDGIVTESEIKYSPHPPQNPQEKNIENLNSGLSTDGSESSALGTKSKTADSDFANNYDLSMSPPTIRRKRKHSSSYRDILPQTTPLSVAFHCDINQSSDPVKPRQKRRSYKKEEQNVILQSVMDYILEEVTRNASVKEFELPESEYAKAKARHQKKSRSKDSCEKAENSLRRRPKTKMVGITKTFKENPDPKPESSLEKPPDILDSVSLEESEHFPERLAKPAETLQNSVPECPINDNSSKSVSQNLINCVGLDGSKDLQELDKESADTPKRIPNRKIDAKTVNYPVDYKYNSKVSKKCLAFTKTASVENPKSLTDQRNHRSLAESQTFSASLDRIFFRNSGKCRPKKVVIPRKIINTQTKDLEPKTSPVNSQDLLDSIAPDESFGDKVPLFPQCNDGLSQLSVAQSRTISVVSSVPNDLRMEPNPKRSQNTGEKGSKKAENCLPDIVETPRTFINNRTPDLESNSCRVDSQDLLDSVGLDETFGNQVPLFPRCNEGLSHFSDANSKRWQNIGSPTASLSKNKDDYHLHTKGSPTDIFPKNNDNDHLLTKGSPTDSFSKNKDDYLLHTKESPTDIFLKNNDIDHLHAKKYSSLQSEIEVVRSDSKTDFLSNNNNNTDIHSFNEVHNKTISSQNFSPVRSELTQGIYKENKNTISTIRGTSCDKSCNKNVTPFETEKMDHKSSPHSVNLPNVLPASRRDRDSDYPLPSNENLSKGGDSLVEEMSSPSLKVKTCVHNFPSSVCDSDKFNHKTFQGFKKAESFRLPGSNEEVVSLLNSRFCPPSGYNDHSPMSARDLLVCVTQCSIYFWTLTHLGQWVIVHQQQITELEQCCSASLHPVQNGGVGVATLLVNAQGQSRLVLHAFQMQHEDVEKKKKPPLAVTSQQIHKLMYSSLNHHSIAVARISREKTIDVCKYVFSEDLSSVENILTLDFLSEKLLSLSAVQGLPAALLGLTATNIILIWNHVANVLLTKISLSDILVKSCTLPSAFTEQGHIVFPLIFDDGPEHGCLLAVNPNTDIVVKLLSYQRHLFPETKSDTRMARILQEHLLSVQDNVLGIWDLYSGSLLACVNSFGMTSMTFVHCDKEVLLITGHKQSCLHIYRSSQLQT